MNAFDGSIETTHPSLIFFLMLQLHSLKLHANFILKKWKKPLKFHHIPALIFNISCSECIFIMFTAHNRGVAV